MTADPADSDAPEGAPDRPAEQAADRTAGPTAAPLALITGMSGAGNSTAIRALEDMGFEAIDNLPLSFMDRLFPDPPGPAEAPATASAPDARPLALGLDVRTRGFSAEALLDRLEALRARPDLAPTLVFLDCAEPALLDRFKTTRRRHPLAPAEGVGAGIARERELLWPVRERADLVIDTTDLTPHDLKARLAELAAPGAAPRLAVSVQSFSFKRGAPREADTVFDCRFLRNPHWSPELRALDGRDAPVAEHVAGDPLYPEFMDRILGLTLALLPAYRREGKAYYCIALGCSGGRHRSVAAAESLAAGLRAAGWATALRHRELGEGAGGPDAAPQAGPERRGDAGEASDHGAGAQAAPDGKQGAQAAPDQSGGAQGALDRNGGVQTTPDQSGGAQGAPGDSDGAGAAPKRGVSAGGAA